MTPLDVIVAGGGVAGLEALLAVRAHAGDRVRLTLIAPDAAFSYHLYDLARRFRADDPEPAALARRLRSGRHP